MSAPNLSPWRLQRVHHLGITVRDVERSIAFYRDLLGMTLVRRRPVVDADYVAKQTGYPGVQLSVASLAVAPDAQPTLELAQYLTHSAQPADTASNRPGNSHLCLVVDDLDACYVQLTQRGVRFRSAPVEITAGPNQGGKVAYFYDPDEYTLELFQPNADALME